MKKYILLFALTYIFCSCSDDLLQEKQIATLTASYYTTAQGVYDLQTSAYEALRWRFDNEQGYSLTNYGVDEMTVGNGTDMIEYNDYNSSLNGDESSKRDKTFYGVTNCWNRLYEAINMCNLGIQSLPSVPLKFPYNTETSKINAEAQFRFLRAFYYFDLVQQFGSVPLVTQSTNTVDLEFPKATIKELYVQIMTDFRFAATNLKETESELGRATIGAANHFLAKAYLTRGSEVNQSWNTNYKADFDSAAYFAGQVIAKVGTTYVLEPDFATLFNYTTVDGPNEFSKEIILAAQFTNTTVVNGTGNRMHLYSLSNYEDMPGMIRDIANGRPWRRLMPTDYAYDVYDRASDSRFFKTFKFAWMANKAGSIPLWGEGNVAGMPAGTLKFQLGDTALVTIVNGINNPIDTAVIAKWRYRAFVRYVKGESGNIIKMMPDGVKQHFACVSKYIDPTRSTVAQAEGYRDGILARVAETYLIAAEAFGRNGNYNKAMEYINILRKRASYKAGEPRNSLYQISTGSSDFTGSTESNMLIKNVSELTTIPSDPILATCFPPSATTPAKIFICHILNERSRELMLELVRWQDLARTSTLIERATLYNGTAKPVGGKHELRPIPVTFIDGLYTNGHAMTATEKVAYQNPGY